MLRRAEIALKFFGPPARSEVALDLIAQRFDQSRHGDQHGHALVSNRAHHFGGIQRVEKNRRGAENLRQKIPSSWPKTWLSGSRSRNRSG